MSWISRRALHGRSRSLVKTLVYRLLMIVITIVVAYVFTDSVAAALNIGIVTNVVKTLIYYGYERAWNHISWGIET